MDEQIIQQSEKQKPKFWIWLIIVLVIFVFLGVLYLLFFNGGQGGETVNAMDAIENAVSGALS